MRCERILYVRQEGDPEWALEHALDLGRRTGARVELAACVGEVSADLVRAAGMDEAYLEQIAADEARRQLEEASGTVPQGGEPIPLKVLRGRPFMSVIREVLQEGHDLVLIAAPERMGRAARLMTPSLAMHLMRKCPVPVWLMRPPSRPVRRIGVAVDADDEEDVRVALDRSLVAAGLAVARAYSASLVVFHALQFFPSEIVLRHRAGVPEAAITALVARARDRVGRNLENLARSTGSRATTQLLEGRAVVEIPRFVTHADLDLLVMGTVGRVGIAGLFIGNTAEEILQRVECSILALKPEGFGSPVS